MKLNLTAVLRKDKVNSDNQHPLVIRVSYGGEKSRVGLGYSLEPEKWNSEDETPTKRCDEKVRREIVKKIEEEKVRIEKVFRDYYKKEGEYPTHPELLKLLKESKGRRNSKTTFNQQIIREYTDFIRERKLKIATYKAYRTTLVRLEEFLKEYKLGSYKELNDKFHNTFITKLEKENYRAGTVGKYTKNIKAFLNHLAKQGKINPAQYKDFRIQKSPQIKPTLSISDIWIMKYALGLEKNTKYSKLNITLKQEEKNILIVFLWLCMTGQSFLDYQSLKLSNITTTLLDKKGGQLIITYNRTKIDTTQNVVITLTPELLELLICYFQQFDFGKALLEKRKALLEKKVASVNKKLDNDEKNNIISTIFLSMISIKNEKIHKNIKKELPHYPYILPKYTIQYYNRTLKEVCEKIGLTHFVSSSVKFGGKEKETREDRLCDLITSHYGRAYFIQNCWKNGLGYEEIMKASGISSLSTILLYNQLSKETLVEKILKLPTFTPDKDFEDSIVFNINLNKENEKNNTPSRQSQIRKK